MKIFLTLTQTNFFKHKKNSYIHSKKLISLDENYFVSSRVKEEFFLKMYSLEIEDNHKNPLDLSGRKNKKILQIEKNHILQLLLLLKIR